ncbi:F0F1 ATP synthase subunit B [Lacihabitans lacunae]|jgi:F-type H+-transporting ATPase subunit b|uniref:ATP synthase subunit b n=1 Tax=Lacihabitans lacunae TaxID=1028214 RepID=A0ABV7YTQ9_9BACT
MELLNPSPGLLFWQLVVFGSLVFLLWKFAWKGIIAGLKEREGDIESALRMAEETRAEMAKLKSDNETLVAEARKERDSIIKEAKEASERMISEAKSQAVTASNKVMEDAREALAQERVAMISQVKKEVATLSIEIAEKVMRKELSDKKSQQTFVSELISDAKLN